MTMPALLKSRKFWLLVLDVVISVSLHFVGQYGTPAAYDNIQFLIVTLQPVFVTIIGAIAYEDGQAAKKPAF
jgi:uncharacterized Tic20 family protein